MDADVQPRIYPIAKNWSRVFWPRVPQVQDTLRRAMQTIRHDFDPAVHIPREAGAMMDAPWPRSRRCAQAFHMYGHCHVIAAVMLDLTQRAYPKREWAIINAQKHSVVVSRDGVVIDINASHDPPVETLARIQLDCLIADHRIWPLVEEYITEHLVAEAPFGEPKGMPQCYMA